MLRNFNQAFNGKRLMFRWATGVLGGLVPASGDTGAAWMYPSLRFPEAYSREYRYWIAAHTFPAGTLPPDDTGALTLTSPAAGVYAAVVLLYEFDVYAKAFAVTLTVGDGPTFGASQGSVALQAPEAATYALTSPAPHLGEPFTPNA